MAELLESLLGSERDIVVAVYDISESFLVGSYLSEQKNVDVTVRRKDKIVVRDRILHAVEFLRISELVGPAVENAVAALILLINSDEIIFASPHPDGILQVIRSGIKVIGRCHP